MLDLERNWPVYIMLAGVVIFFAYMVIKGNKPGKRDGE